MSDALFSLVTEFFFQSKQQNLMGYFLSMINLYTFLAELCFVSICKHEIDDECYDKFGCNIQPTWLQQCLLQQSLL